MKKTALIGIAAGAVLALAAAALLPDWEGTRMAAGRFLRERGGFAGAGAKVVPEGDRNSVAQRADKACGWARNRGLPVGSATPVVLRDDRPLAWVLRASRADRPEVFSFRVLLGPRRDYRLYFSFDAATRAGKALEGRGYSTSIESVRSWRPWFDADSPISAGASARSEADLAYFIIHDRVSGSFGFPMNPFADEASWFIAGQAVEEYLASASGTGEVEYEAWRARRADEAAFASLFPDLRSRILGLYAGGGEAKAIADTRERLEKAWLDDFRLRYSSRFIGNEWKDFGKDGLANAELLFRSPAGSRYAYFQAAYSRFGRDLAALSSAARTVSREADPFVSLSALP